MVRATISREHTKGFQSTMLPRPHATGRLSLILGTSLKTKPLTVKHRQIFIAEDRLYCQALDRSTFRRQVQEAALSYKMPTLHHTFWALVPSSSQVFYERHLLADMDSLDSPIWRSLESAYGYFAPNPPPRRRDPNSPVQVLCVGLPRSGTESLQQALLTLGYDYTYHVRPS